MEGSLETEGMGFKEFLTLCYFQWHYFGMIMRFANISYRHNLDNPDCLSHVFNRVETINKTMGKTND